ncbi:MAG: flagellar biosynthesis protein FlhF [Methylohalobius sp. ZOD2]|nr:flagellar biosynthesis protein FlhF [Methylothermaceae bacterium]
MKIKRFLAPDTRQALQQVKEALGSDAVILSNRKTDQGVEIIATLDFDMETVAQDRSASRESKPSVEAPPRPPVTPQPAFSARGYGAVADATGRDKIRRRPAPASATPRSAKTPKESFSAPAATGMERRPAGGRVEPPSSEPAAESFASLRRELQQMRRLLDRHLSREAWREAMGDHPTRLDLLRALNELGFAQSLALNLAKRAGIHEDLDDALGRVRQMLAEQVAVYDDPLLEYGGIAALVGPTGVGKTTTIAKLAARCRLKHGPRQIALVTTDNYRIAAHEQLSTYARILGVPIRVAGNSEELQSILRGFLDKKLILIDTSGMSPRDLRLAERFALLRDTDMAIETYLVLSATAQSSSLYEAIDAFADCRPRACILTKLDETGCLGPALSALIERGMPAAFFTDGQQVPEDLHPARSETLIRRCFDAARVSLQAADMDFDVEDWIAHASA